MADFEALIKARLDSTKFKQEMDQVRNARYELTNVGVNANHLVSEIEKALHGQTFDININPVITTGGSGNGSNLSQAVETAVNTGIGNHPVTVDLKNALQFKGIDSNVADSIIKSISQDIDTATLKLKFFDAQFEETLKDGRSLQSIRFVGIDEDGKTLNILSRIDKKTGEVASTVTHVTQKFDVETKSVDKTTSAFERLLEIQKQMNSISLERAKLNPSENSGEIQILISQLRSLRDEYNRLFSQYGSSLSTDQRNRLNNEEQKFTDKVGALRSSIQDDIELKISTKKVEADISNVTHRINELRVSSSGDVIDLGLDDDLAELQRLQSLMDNTQSSIQLKNTYGEFSTLLDTVKSKLTIIFNKNKDVVSSLDVTKLSNKMQTWLDKNTRASKDYGEAIAALKARLEEASKSGMVAKGVFDEVDQEFKKIQQSAIAAGKVGQSFGTKLKKAFSGIIGVVSVSSVLSKTADIIKDMYQAVYDIDTAMVSLRKVTDETASTYERFLSNSAESAKALGRTISSLVEQTAEWSKLGYSLDEAEKLAKLSSIYANVAEVDDSTAVSDIVTAMKAFGLETAEAERVVDSLNELGNRFATDAASLGAGLSNSASALNVAGSDLYESLAMLTGITEITQDASGAGNMLKVSSMRIRGMKGELEELGEEVDDTVDSISKVQTQILNLTHGKVNIFDDSGEFRNYFTIMKEIADIYDDLTSTEQASLSEILFGKNRGNQGAALIQAFQSGQIQKAYESAVNSAGSAAAEQAAWMDSLEAKTQQLKAAYEELSQTVLNSDFLKGLVDTGTKLIEGLTTIIDKLGVLPTLLAAGGITAFVKNLDWAIASNTYFPKFLSESNSTSSNQHNGAGSRYRCWEVL